MGWNTPGSWECGGGWYSAVTVPPSGGSDAAQTTAFLSRVSAAGVSLDTTHTNAYKALINGLVSDGTFSLLDILYIFATQAKAAAQLNLISSSFTITELGTVSWLADNYYSGQTTGALATGYTPSTSGQMTLNSGSVGVYLLDSVDQNIVEIGCGDGTNAILFKPLSGGNVQAEFNGASYPTAANTSAIGAWTATRTGSTSVAVYKNGSSTAFMTGSDTSVATIGVTSYVCGFNNNGSQLNGSRKVAAAFAGGGLTGAQSAAINNRINTFMASLATPINVY
jgi:hypothetical protein